MGFLRRSIKRDCLRASANGNHYPFGQLDALHARADLLSTFVNGGAAKKSIGSKLAHDHEGLANSVRGDFHRELHDAHCIKEVMRRRGEIRHGPLGVARNQHFRHQEIRTYEVWGMRLYRGP